MNVASDDTTIVTKLVKSGIDNIKESLEGFKF